MSLDINLNGPQLLGLATIAVLALLVMLLVLRRRSRMVWLLALCLLVVGLGYSATTTAPTNLARMIYGRPA